MFLSSRLWLQSSIVLSALIAITNKHKLIVSSGGAVAIQKFFENVAMLLASGVYALVAGIGADPANTMIWLGVLVLIATTIVSWRLPRDTGELSQ